MREGGGLSSRNVKRGTSLVGKSTPSLPPEEVTLVVLSPSVGSVSYLTKSEVHGGLSSLSAAAADTTLVSALTSIR